MVKDFLQRKDVSDAQVMQWANLAKLRLQRDDNLSLAVRKTTLSPYPTTEGVGIALPSDFKGFYGEFSVVILNAAGGVTPLKGSTLTQALRRTRDRGANTWTKFPTAEIVWYAEPQENGLIRLFLFPEISAASLKVWYYVWLPDYVSSTDEDILLTIGRDALLWETLKVANMFLTEEDRVKVDDALASAAIAKVEDWCSRVLTSGATLDLN